MQTKLSIEDLKNLLPHREPMLLIEEATVDEYGVSKSKYQIKEGEFFTQGHFPGNPIVPGVILCEIMAQSCATTVKEELSGCLTLYAGIDKVRFKRQVKPGDICEITSVLKEKRQKGTRKMIFCSSKLSVDGKVCCQGELIFAIVPKTENI